MPNIIQPTVGRVVLFHAPLASRWHGADLTALICHVNGPRNINVAVFDGDGKLLDPEGKQGVLLVQPGDPLPEPTIGYCTWMPYQIGQALKAEQLQQEIDELQRDIEAAEAVTDVEGDPTEDDTVLGQPEEEAVAASSLSPEDV